MVVLWGIDMQRTLPVRCTQPEHPLGALDKFAFALAFGLALRASNLVTPIEVICVGCSG